MRTLLFMLLPILASGQIYIDSYKFQGAAANLLLDDYPGAAAAYSLRLLDKDYTGDCITVRRTSDNALDTFGFVNNYLDTTSLKSFCGTGGTDSCFVRIWWDQSGNGFNLSQTTNANQPAIVISGALHKDNSNVSIKFFYLSGSYMANTSASLSYMTTFSVTSMYSRVGSGSYIYRASSGVTKILTDVVGQSYRIFSGTNLYSGITPSLTTQDLIYALHDGASSEIRIDDNSTTSGNSGTNAGTGILIATANAANPTTAALDGSFQEFILYNSNESSNRAGIATNINTFYSIY